jgi:hypothetical protein
LRTAIRAVPHAAIRADGIVVAITASRAEWLCKGTLTRGLVLLQLVGKQLVWGGERVAVDVRVSLSMCLSLGVW